MEFIPYQPKFLEDCQRVFQSNVPFFFMENELDEFVDFIENEPFPYWVVRHQNEIIGCGGIYEADEKFGRAEFENEVGFAWGMIEDKYHKQGFGKELARFRLNYLLEHFENRPIVLRTTQNTADFFKKFGFTILRTEPNGFGEGMDKIIMVHQKE